MEEVRQRELEAELANLLQAQDTDEDRWTIACIQQMY
jgi:hypothetical protein